MGFLPDIFNGLFSNIVSGLIGGGVVWAIVELYNKWRRQRLRKQFPIGGRYVSRYEDFEGDRKVIQKAEATLNQKGLQLAGITQNFNEQRAWNFRLNIDGHFVHGIYGQSDPRDNSTGVVFLEVKPSGAMEGIYAGWDSKNQRVEGGRYWFKRATDFNIKELQLSRGNTPHQALDILRGELGKRYVTRETFDSYVHRSNKGSFKVALVAVNSANGKVVGVLLAEIANEAVLKDSFLGSYTTAMTNPDVFRLRNQTTGLLKSIAVDHAYQGNGVATALIQRAMQILSAQGAKGFYALGWLPKGQERCNITGVLESMNFKPVQRFDRFWYNDSIASNYECPVCGKPCNCSAELFITQ